MEARLLRTACAVVFACVLAGADHRTDNFSCNAATKEVAVRVCEDAERYRRELAIEWLGKELPRWNEPCPITVQVGERLGAGGATSFVFDRGQVFGWQMTIQGSLERVLDSVLPHEVTHTIFASHFRQPLPRWADEGACTTVEHVSERTKQQKMLVQFLQTGRGIPFSAMFAMKEYPQDVLPLYAQGHSLTSWLIAHGGKQKFLEFVGDGLESEDWVGVLNRHYGIRSLGQLQNTWLDWVAQGSPAIAPQGPGVDREPVLLASTTDGAAQQAAASPVSQGPNGRPSRPQPNLIQKSVYDAMPIEPAPSPQQVAAAQTAATVELAASRTPTNAVTSDLQEIAPSRLVPLNADAIATPTPASSSPIYAAAVPSQAESDPFAGRAAAPPSFSTAGRPQPSQTTGQVILQWSQQGLPPQQAVPNTTMRPAAPIFYDGATTGGTLVR